MSKAVKAVTKAVGGVVGGVTGSLFGGGGSPGALGTGRFQGSTRKINKDAFVIQKGKQYEGATRDQKNRAAQRSKAAQENRKNLISDLEAQARGEAPSLAEAQLRSATDRNLAQQLAAAQSQRGGSASLRQRELMRGQAAAGREVSQDAATARLQERQMAQQLLGEQIGQEQQLADQLVQNYLSQGFNIQQARQQALADYEKAQTAQFLQAQGLSAQGFEGSAARRAELGPQLFQGFSSLFGLAGSDKNIKKNIKKVGSKDSSKSISDKDKKEKIKEYNKTQAQKGVALAKKRRESEKSDQDKLRKKIGKSVFGKIDKETGESDLVKSGKRAAAKSRQAVANAAPNTSFSSLLSSLSDEKSKIKIKEKDNTNLEMDTDKVTSKTAQPSSKKEKSGFDIGQLSELAKLAGPAMAAASDKELKKQKEAYSDKNIKKDFLDKLQAYTYEYKDEYKDHPLGGRGQQMSVMAQDLEKAGPIGKAMVQDTDEGFKAVDYAKGYGAILAAQAHLNKRLDELEKTKKKPKKG
jgi:hypothetical protein